MLALLFLTLSLQDSPIPADRSASDWVPFTLNDSNQIQFSMDVGGQRVSAILDSGISTTLITPALADAHHLPIGRTSRATAIGGAITVGWTTAPDLQVGGFRRRPGRIIVADMAAVSNDAALYLGADFLDCCALDIDYSAQKFRLLPSGTLPFTGLTAPLARMRDGGTFVTQIRVNGQSLRPILIDTGDGGSVTLSRHSWQLARPVNHVTTTSLGYGAGGAIVQELAILPRINIGMVESGPSEVRIESPNGYSKRTGTAGRLGTGFLRQYRVLLDARAGHMILRPNSGPPANPVRSTSGLLLSYHPGKLEVLHVMRGSPAEQAGWRQGEQICSVQGAAVEQSIGSDGTIAWTVGPPGQRIQLQECGSKQARDITLRYFY